MARSLQEREDFIAKVKEREKTMRAGARGGGRARGVANGKEELRTQSAGRRTGGGDRDSRNTHESPPRSKSRANQETPNSAPRMSFKARILEEERAKKKKYASNVGFGRLVKETKTLREQLAEDAKPEKKERRVNSGPQRDAGGRLIRKGEKKSPGGGGGGIPGLGGGGERNNMRNDDGDYSRNNQPRNIAFENVGGDSLDQFSNEGGNGGGIPGLGGNRNSGGGGGIMGLLNRGGNNNDNPGELQGGSDLVYNDPADDNLISKDQLDRLMRSNSDW